MKITLSIPPRCLSPNFTVASRGGRMGKAAAIKKYRNAAMLACLAALSKGITPRWKAATVQVHWFAKTMRFPDGDNALATLKSAFDGMTDAGLFADDKGLTHLPVKFAKDKDNPRIEILIDSAELMP